MRRLVCAAFALLGIIALARHAVAQPAPAWKLHYFYSTFICGGTVFDADASGSFELAWSSCNAPSRTVPKRTGTLSERQLRQLEASIAASDPSTWSAEYIGSANCLEHAAGLQLAQTANGAQRTYRTRWSCGLEGVPADLRALIVALRGDVQAIAPQAMVDAMPRLEATPMSAHASWTLVTRPGELADRSVSIAADGRIVARERTSRTLYPLAPCPAASFTPLDAATLAMLRVLQTPSERIPYVTSAETKAIFERVTADCPVRADGFVSPEWLVAPGVRWILSFGSGEGYAAPSIIVDGSGAYVARRAGAADVRGALDAATLRALDALVTAVHDERWSRSFGAPERACRAFAYVTHVDARGNRRMGPLTEGPCDGDGAPEDLRALLRFGNASLVSRAPARSKLR